MNRPKLENTIKLETHPAPLVVVDFHVYLHSIKMWVEKCVDGYFSSEVGDKLIKGAWALRINRGPDMLPRHQYRIIVIADSRFKDTGNYWRDLFMSESLEVKNAWISYAEKEKIDLSTIPTNYKGTRKEKDESFWRVHNIGWDYVNSFFPVFSLEGFEADDIMGAIYRLSRDGKKGSVVKERQILMSTLDRDWSQLVDEEHKVFFANTRIPFPSEKIQERLVGNQGVIEHTKHKMGFDLDHPRNLSDWKVKHGDMGDNLPSGSPKSLFDLCQPNVDFVVERMAPWYDDLVECVNNPSPNVREDHFMETLRQFAKINFEAPTVM